MNAHVNSTPWLDEIRLALADNAGPGAAAEFQGQAEYVYQLYAETWGEAWGQHAVRQAAKAVLANTATLTDSEVEAARAAGHEAGRPLEEEVTSAAYARHADEVCQAWSERDAAFIAAHRSELQATWPEGFAVAAASMADGSGQSVAFADFGLIWNATAGFLGALHRPAERAIAQQAPITSDRRLDGAATRIGVSADLNRSAGGVVAATVGSTVDFPDKPKPGSPETGDQLQAGAEPASLDDLGLPDRYVTARVNKTFATLGEPPGPQHVGRTFVPYDDRHLSKEAAEESAAVSNDRYRPNLTGKTFVAVRADPIPGTTKFRNLEHPSLTPGSQCSPARPGRSRPARPTGKDNSRQAPPRSLQ
jgi:hypothetical protein